MRQISSEFTCCVSPSSVWKVSCPCGTMSVGWCLSVSCASAVQLTRQKHRSANTEPIEMRGSQLIGLNLVMRHRGQWHSMCV